MSKIGVGVVGASPTNPGWAVVAHLPAIKALPAFELRAVSTSRPETARAAAEAFGVAAFDNAQALIERPDVDLVVVAVKAPDHEAVIVPALQAGKMVFSEWPLGANLREAEGLAARAREAKVRTVIGLQARYAPAVRYARDLIAQGYVGEVLASTMTVSGMAWGARTERAHTYWFDAASGANPISVPVLHALDAAAFVLGEFKDVSAAVAARRPFVELVEDGTKLPVTAPDHVAISATLQSGAILSVFGRGATSRGGNLHWEINGTAGDLVLTAANGNLQVADLNLTGGRGDQTGVEPLGLPETYAQTPGGLSGGMGANVLREYAALARDLEDGTDLVPGFELALRRHRLLAAIEEAGRSGVRQTMEAAR